MTPCSHIWRTHTYPASATKSSRPNNRNHPITDDGQAIWMYETCTNCQDTRWAYYRRNDQENTFILEDQDTSFVELFARVHPGETKNKFNSQPDQWDKQRVKITNHDPRYV